MLPVMVPDELLEADQKEAISRVKAWVQDRSNRVYRVGGRAGTGKTTIIRKVLDSVKPGPVAISAYTGKATSILRKKGITQAQTIHSLMYKLDSEASTTAKPVFRKVKVLGCEFVIIDEGSMVGKEIIRDLWSFTNVRLLIFGDHWQLEPIGEDINLMEGADFLLEKVHRQAALSNIISFAEGCYRGTERFEKRDLPDLRVCSAPDFWSCLEHVEQGIVGFNDTRHRANQFIRGKKGFKKDYPEAGEKVIFLKNNYEFGLYNGMVARVTRVRNLSSEVVSIDVEDDLGQKWLDVPTYRRQYGCNSLVGVVKVPYILADFGYVLTSYKSQGSEWETGAVLEELHPDWNANRVRYTTVTRFSKHLSYFR